MDVAKSQTPRKDEPAEREIHAGQGPADAMPPPEGLSRAAVLRALDRERLMLEAPDLAPERVARLVKLLDDARAGRLLGGDRLREALRRALADDGGRRPRA